MLMLSADSDPHFLLHIPHGNLTVCFNVMGKQGEIYNLISDPELGKKMLDSQDKMGLSWWIASLHIWMVGSIAK